MQKQMHAFPALNSEIANIVFTKSHVFYES